MKHFSRPRLATLVLIGAILACNLPGNNPPPISVNDQAATSVAATLSAEAPNSLLPATAAPSATTAASATAARAATTTVTPTFSTPMLTVLESTNCREGPGQDYEVVFTYLPKKQLQILGRYDPTNYWLVKSAESKTGSCWLWGEYVETTGSYWAVPSVTPPATATLAPPPAPSLQKWEYFCSVGQMTITIQWTDRATDETGYRILRDGESVAELAANSTAYTETIPMLAGDTAEYYLQVYGPGGTSSTIVGKLTC